MHREMDIFLYIFNLLWLFYQRRLLRIRSTLWINRLDLRSWSSRDRCKEMFIAQLLLLGLINNSGQEINDRLLCVNLVIIRLLHDHVLDIKFAIFEILQAGMESSHSLLISASLLQFCLLHELRQRDERFALSIERAELYVDLLEFQFFSHLDAIDYFGCQIELLVKLFDDLILNYTIGSAQTTFISLTRAKGQHVIVLVCIGFPQYSKQRKFELFSSIFPIIIDCFRKLVSQIHLKQLFVLFLKKSSHPTFASRQSHILSCFQFKLCNRFFEELVSQHFFALKIESILMCLDKGVVDLGKFIVMSRWQVEQCRQTDVVGCNFCKLLNFSDSFDTLYFWYRDLFFFVGCSGLGLVCWNDDEGVFVSIDFVKLGFGVYELEWFGPIESFAVAHKQ